MEMAFSLDNQQSVTRAQIRLDFNWKAPATLWQEHSLFFNQEKKNG